MALVVHNTLHRRKEPFVPIDPPKVGMYVCGLTVYDYAHIGHARTHVAFEVVRRWLKASGYHVVFVQNVTDVDDKIIARANELKRDPQQLAAEWDAICANDMRRLGVSPPDVAPHVTDHMGQIIRLVATLIERKAAYVAPDGSVYYSVASKKDYGKLSNRTAEDMMAGARVEPAEGKKDPKDFALWKAAKPGEPAWDSPWGKGRPGWHIECSAMAMTYLGATVDIHGGGVDLVFPHHENEVAQSESATGQPFAKYWMHTGFLSVGGEKMSKSLKNFVTIQDILKTTDPEVIRFFYAHTHYRSSIDFTPEALADAGRGLERLRRARDALKDAAKAKTGASAGDEDLASAAAALAKSFKAAMDDDFNTREAIAALFAFATESHKALSKGVGHGAAEDALAVFLRLSGVLTILESSATVHDNGLSDQLVDLLLSVREAARAKKAFDLSDRIRDDLKALGIEVSDGKDGAAWRRVET
jgi:cysteinyl-tRNA synthetase